MKLNEYAIFEYCKNLYSFDTLEQRKGNYKTFFSKI